MAGVVVPCVDDVGIAAPVLSACMAGQYICLTGILLSATWTGCDEGGHTDTLIETVSPRVDIIVYRLRYVEYDVQRR